MRDEKNKKFAVKTIKQMRAYLGDKPNPRSLERCTSGRSRAALQKKKLKKTNNINGILQTNKIIKKSQSMLVCLLRGIKVLKTCVEFSK